MDLRKLLNIRIAILGIWALALIATAIIIGPDRIMDIYRSLSPQGIKNSIDSFGALSVLIFLIASLIRPLLLLPTSPFTLASGFMFGMWWGLLWSMIGTTISAIFIYFLSRYILRDFVSRRLKGRYPSVDKMLEGRDWSFIVFLRLIPVLPFDVVSCFAGASQVKFRDFLVGTLIGESPGAIVLVMLGTSLDDIGSGFFYISIVMAAAVLAGTELVRRRIGKLRAMQRE